MFNDYSILYLIRSLWYPTFVFQGEWKPKQIDNPDYKGKWIHPEIDNPEYEADDTLYMYKDFSAIGFDLWQVCSTVFALSSHFICLVYNYYSSGEVCGLYLFTLFLIQYATQVSSSLCW